MKNPNGWTPTHLSTTLSSFGVRLQLENDWTVLSPSNFFIYYLFSLVDISPRHLYIYFRVNSSYQNFLTFSWFLNPNMKNSRQPAPGMSHLPFFLLSHSQQNIYYCLLVLFWVSFPVNCSLACENTFTEFDCKHSIHIWYFIHLGSSTDTVKFTKHRSVLLLFTWPSLYVSHNNFVKSCFFISLTIDRNRK